ncbi:hypothetical protein BIW11_05077 [Tropilaelaps mercedesae]|uniref:Uncharacterized protein n=1 Tax=Tropilaelaps mercedesae TaxID=418985 RepID=A0A1V9Y3U4_9ACAR|nr:hypothetical protein BIW11_05077 [Tropilaelaps mercedesae]OQR80405.1 hypothetical protein BIW11_05077 [Tropilaelaps mercedesae]OQR80406.1 hypothetical protein BIW11_05077 [Tropilaelaps mercedesae]
MEPRIVDVLSQLGGGPMFERLLNELKNSDSIEKHLGDMFIWTLNHGEARHVDFLLDAGLIFHTGSELESALRHLLTVEPSERCREIYRRLFGELRQRHPKKCRAIVSALFTAAGVEIDKVAFEWIQFFITECCQADYGTTDLYALALTGHYRVTRLLDRLFAERPHNLSDRRQHHYHSIVCTLGAICVFRNDIPTYLRIRPRYKDMLRSIKVPVNEFGEIQYLLESRKQHNINKVCIYKALKHLRATIWCSSSAFNSRYRAYYRNTLERAVDTTISLLKSSRDRLKIVIRLADVEQRIFNAGNTNALRLARTILQPGTLKGCLDNLTCKDFGKVLRRLCWTINQPDAWLHDMLFDKLIEFSKRPIIDSTGRNDLLYALLWYFDTHEHSKASSRSERVLRILLENGLYVASFDDGPLPLLFAFTVTYPASWFFKRSPVTDILESQCWCMHPVGHLEVPQLRCLAAARVTSNVLLQTLDAVHMFIGNGRVRTSVSQFIRAHETLELDRRLFRQEFSAIVRYRVCNERPQKIRVWTT